MKRNLTSNCRSIATIHRVIGCLIAAIVVIAAGSPAVALIVKDPAVSTSAPTGVGNDPGWNNFTSSGRNYIYLGDRWALSARHVGPTSGELQVGKPPQSLTFSTGTFQLMSGEHYIIRNPDTTTTTSGMANLTSQTDLQLVRLADDPGLPSIFGPNPSFRLATQAPPLSGEVLFIGHGRSQDGVLTHWNPNNGWSLTSACSSQSNNCRSGFFATDPNDDTKRWGNNRLANANNYHNEGAFSHVISTTTGILPVQTADGVTRDVVSLITAFDLSGTNHEAQVVDKDSGSAVFYKRGGQWELAGIVNANLGFSGQPNSMATGFTAVYGNAATIADISFYNRPYLGSICDVMKSCGNYSMNGDVNLDGVVSGDGTGAWATDDVTAFAQGWQFNNDAGKGDYVSWTNGDLNQDGTTNVADFFLLRGALQGAGAGAGIGSLSELVGSAAGVPEPAALVLVAFGAGLLSCGRRANRR
jgi:hypothetical protein